MITELEFCYALEIISKYESQLKNKLKEGSCSRRVNIQNDLSKSTFKVLQNYYEVEFKIDLKKENLCSMDAGLLSLINYDRLNDFRGIGKVGVKKFKKLMSLHFVLK